VVIHGLPCLCSHLYYSLGKPSSPIYIPGRSQKELIQGQAPGTDHARTGLGVEFHSGYNDLMGLTEYIETAMTRAQYKLLKNGLILGTIPGCKGVWAEGRSLDTCRNELQEVLEDWIVLKLRDGDRLPNFGKQTLKVPSAVHA